MTAPERGFDDITTDVVEYLVVTVPDPHALVAVVEELVRLGESATIRVLDVAVLRMDAAGQHAVVTVDGLEEMRALASCYEILLSSHDLELVALALQPGDYALIVVAEDRWAQSLAWTARASGGEIRAGERIARGRVEAALARASSQTRTEE